MSKPLLRLEVDYGQYWPLSDIFWDDHPKWEEILTPELMSRLRAWAKFFNHHADWESGSFGSEERRRWFDLEGFALLKALEDEVGHIYDFRLNLWFEASTDSGYQSYRFDFDREGEGNGGGPTL